MHHAKIASALVLTLLTAPSEAQSFNIDFNNTSGAGSGAPSSSFAGAAGQSGFWNAVPVDSVGPGAVRDIGALRSGLTGVTIQAVANSGYDSGTFGTGDHQKLMGDYADGFGATGSVSLTFSGLDEGYYLIYMYTGLDPANATYVNSFNDTVPHVGFTSVSRNNVVQESATTAGVAASNTFVRGANYVLFTLNQPAGAPAVKLLNLCDSTYFAARVAVNGVQFVKWPGNRIYVDDSATGSGNGTSWLNAMNRIEDALARVQDSEGVITEVWVAAGTYKPTTTADRTRSFTLLDGVKLYGGFAGTESTLDQRDINANPTILSGDIGTPGDSGDNSHHVVDASGCGFNTVLDGFIIERGRANFGSNDFDKGAGLYGLNSAIQVRGCTFRFHFAQSQGGAVYLAQPGLIGPEFTECTFHNNQSVGNGAAMRYIGSQAGFIPPLLSVQNCRFIANISNGSSSALYIDGGDAVVYGSLFNANNCAASPALAAIGAGVDVSVRNCTIVNNRGGFGAARFFNTNTCTVYNSIFSGNFDPSTTLFSLSEQIQGNYNMQYTNVNFLNSGVIPPGPGNIRVDPLFVDSNGPDNIAGNLDDDFSLSNNSPSIDAGSNTLAPADFGDLDRDSVINEPAPQDLAGLPRFHDNNTVADTGVGPAPVIDQGAFENQFFFCPADFNGDGFVDFFDFDDYVACFEGLGCPPGKDADINNDGFTDFFDFDDFVALFEAGC